eukprot:jgi/Astpho2/7752/Aster-07594
MQRPWLRHKDLLQPQRTQTRSQAEEWREALEWQEKKQVIEANFKFVGDGYALVTIGKLTGIVSRFQLRPWRLLQLLPDQQQEDPLSMTKVIAGSPVVDWTRGKAWRGEPLLVKVIGVDVPNKRLRLSEKPVAMDELLSRVRAGDVADGIVTGIANSVVYVSMRDPETGRFEGASGIISYGELSWDSFLTVESVVQVGQNITCKVLQVQKQRRKILLSLKQMETDPLRETLDKVLTKENRELITEVPVSIPQGVKDICNELELEDGIEYVVLGRQAEERRVVSQDLELWLSREVVPDGHLLITRAGKTVQELQIKTSLSAPEMKSAVQRVLRRLV